MDFRKGEGGQVLVMTVLSLTVVLGFVGFATDVGLMLRQRRVAQTVADAAALAAATESLSEGTPSSVSSGMYQAALQDATLNGLTPGTSNGTTNSTTGVTLTLNVNPNITVSGYNSAGYVQAIVSMNTGTAFMKMFGISTLNVASTAIASNAIASDGCFYVQNNGSYANPAVDMGGNSLVNAVGCGMTVNGNLTMGGSGSIDAKFVAVTGTYTGYSASSDTGVWSHGVPPQPDPLSKLQLTANQPTVSNGTCTAPSGSGMSCIYDYNNGNLSGTLQSNTIYYYDSAVNGGGGPSITGTVTGSNVTIYLAGNIPFDFSNNGTLSLTPPGYGSSCAGSANPYCGILFDAPTDGSGNNGTYTCSHGKGNNAGNPGEIYFDFGSSTTTLYGVIYAPYMQMFGQDKGASTTFGADLVVGNVCMQSSTFNVDSYSGAQSPITRVGLVY